MAKEKLVPLNLEVQVPENVYESLKKRAGDQPPLAVIAACAKYLLENYAFGGVMLKPTHVTRIVGALPNASNENIDIDIVKAVEKAAGMEDGQHVFKAHLDPAYIQPAQEVADAQGVDLEYLVTDALNTMLGNGWLYDFQTEGGVIRLTMDQLAEIQEILGQKTIFAHDLLNAMRLAKPALELAKVGV